VDVRADEKRGKENIRKGEKKGKEECEGGGDPAIYLFAKTKNKKFFSILYFCRTLLCLLL
jgi:hypothetical protein